MSAASNEPERRHRAEAIAERLATLDPAELGPRLERECGDDLELRREVEALVDGRSLRDRFTTGPTLDRVEGSGGAGPRREADAPPGTKAGPYLLRGVIGAGGMGVVHEAEDTRLGRTVALKLLPRDVGTTAVARDRFYREARTISSLDHPAICAIHDIGETEDGRLYFVMPYYEGRTLRERLEQEPLPVAEARSVAIQLARGLRHAHDHGVTHRDIKPGNVILTEDGQAKLLDFGIARNTDVATLTREGTAMGTPAYMAPEQSRGEPADARSDLWALGVVLYEMLTGARPFDGDDPLAVMNAIATRPATPMADHRRDIPTELQEVVGRLMAKDPAERFQSARELLAALDATSSSEIVTEAAKETGSRRWWAVALALVLVAALAVIPASRSALLRALGGASSSPRLVVVLPLVNNIGTSREDLALAAGLTHSLTGMLARLGAVDDSLWVVPAGEVALREVVSAADARELFGVDIVLTGSVQAVGGSTEVLMSLVDPTVRPPRTLDSRAVVAPLRPEHRAEMLSQLAELFGVRDDARGRLGPDRAPTSSSAAYALHLQGVGYLYRNDQEGNIDRAIASFDEALREDPEFGLAHAGRCQALWDKQLETDDAALGDRARESCERAAELAGSEADVLVAVGRSFFEQGEFRRAKIELERALELDPENAEAFRYLGLSASGEGEGEEAVMALTAAADIEPRAWFYHWDLGEVLLVLGRYEEALERFERSRVLTPENYLVYNALAVTHSELGHDDEAERLFRRSIELRPNPMAYRNIGYQRYRDERYPEAVIELERARDLLEESPSAANDWIVWSWLADAYYWAGERDAAADAWRHLAGVATPLYELNPRDTEVLMLLSDAHVALGELEQGRFYLNRLLALSLDAVYLRYYIGRIYERLGDRELALTYIRQALEQRFDPILVDRDPWLEELRLDPEYQSLRQQYLSSAR